MHQGLSTGAKAGVGVGAFGGIFVIALIGFLFLRRTRTNSGGQLGVGEAETGYHESKPDFTAGIRQVAEERPRKMGEAEVR